MMIALALALGAPVQSAGSEAPPSDDFSVILSEFSRDKSIFDSDSARGNDSADIPLSGSSDAPDGAVIETRIIHADTGAQVLGWADTGTVSAGRWSGSRALARHPHWLRVQARVKGSPLPAAQGANSFGVGMVIFVEDQSNTHRGLKRGLDEARERNGGVIPVTIGNAPGDFQVFWLGDEGDGLRSRIMVSDDNKVTTSLAAMAETFARADPGLKVMIGFDTKSGSPEHDPLNDNRPDRSWANSLDLANALQADGSAVGMAWSMHTQATADGAEVEWYAGAFFGRNADGTLNPDLDPSGGFPSTQVGTINVNHIWPEAYPGLLNGRTQFLIQDIHSSYAKDITDASRGNSIPPRELADNFADRVQYVGHQGGLVQPVADVHWDKGDVERGMPEKFRWMAIGMMRAGGGILDYPLATIDHINWTPDYLEIWSDAGPITTGQRLKGQSTNFPLDPSASPLVEGMAQALGFSDKDLNNIARVEIVDDSGAPAMAGRLRIYPNTTEFSGTSKLYYGLHRSGYQELNGLDRSVYTAAGLSDHFPVVDIGLPTVLGQTLQHPFDSNLINDANTLSAGEPVFAVTGGDVATSSAVNYSGRVLTIAARYVPGEYMRFSRDAGNDSRWRLQALSDGRLQMHAFQLFSFSSAPGVMQPGPDGFCDLLVKLRFEAGQERAEVYINGTPLAGSELFADGAFSGSIRTGRKHSLLTNGSGDVAYIRQWKTFESGTGLPSEAPFIEMRANPAGAFSAAGGGRYDVLDNGALRAP